MYTVRIGEADPRFGAMLLEQFGGANGELASPPISFIRMPIMAALVCGTGGA
ncbi:hypothetical protein [Nguyenibacter vanlangensis]|uniref:hypothetical protein n=1 Tax=Nguyenibacter vanlangensis TaxID=1216886 RepID=UPI0035B52CD8